MNNICYMFNTKMLQLILACHTDILCNRWPLGEVLPHKKMSFVTRDHTYYHIFYKNDCNHKPTYDQFTAQPVITRECITYFYFYISIFCTDTCHKQPLGEVLHSVEICFVTSLLNSYPLHKMATISQTTFSSIFSWMKRFVFWFKFHRSLFLWVQLKIIQH